MINFVEVCKYLKQRALENGIVACRKYKNVKTAFIEWGKLQRLTNACYLEDLGMRYSFTCDLKNSTFNAKWIIYDDISFGFSTCLEYEIMRRVSWM